MSKISIIIPVYNHARELPRALQSIFNQTFKDLEVIVVDDGSTDDLSSALAGFQDRIKVISQENRGAAAARNAGARLAGGEYIIFWDADVVAQPAMLQKMARILEERPETSFVYCSFKFGWKKFNCGPFDQAKLKKINYITTTTLLRRRDFPGFDASLKKFQDWDLWLTMTEQGKGGYWVPEVLFTAKPRRGGMSAWLPSFLYWLPLPRVKDYYYWRQVINKKHQLNKFRIQ